MEELLIPSSVTSLGAGLCYNCASLKKVIVGNGVTSFESGSGTVMMEWITVIIIEEEHSKTALILQMLH